MLALYRMQSTNDLTTMADLRGFSHQDKGYVWKVTLQVLDEAEQIGITSTFT